MEWKIILTLLLSVIAIATGTNYIADVYELDPTSSEVFFQNAVMDRRTRKIYVGAKNRLYEFDENLDVITEVKTGPAFDNPACPVRKYACDEEKKELTQSFSKVILIDYENNHLIHCISLYQGSCFKGDINNIKNLEEIVVDDALVANNDSATSFAFITPGPIKDEKGHFASVINIGVQYTNKGFQRDRVYCFATRKLNNFELAYKSLFRKSATILDSNNRQLFPIKYVYGFGSQGFSYMVTVQKPSPTLESYITKIFRVCQKDLQYYSYAEVQLQCWHNGALYNLAQAVYVGKAGVLLAKLLNIPDTEEVLYVSFSIGDPRSSNPTEDSALCVYPMRTVRRIFSANIQDCFNGKGNTGPGYFYDAVRCKHTPNLEVDDEYCGDHKEVNSPTDGTDPISQEAAITFPSTISSLTIDIVNEYTVAFAGTKKGHIYKIALQTQGNIYEDVPLVEGQEIKPSMFIDLDHEYMYVMTDHKLMKMKLYNCSQYTTCNSCLQAGNPYCGWCSLENKCSLKKDCASNDQVLRWLPYSGSNNSCPSITSVIPKQIQKEYSHSRSIQLNVSNLPSFGTHPYQCVFSYSRNIRIITTNKTLDNPNNKVVRCNTPETHLLPPIPTGEDHIKMNLSIHIWGRDFVSKEFTFFDCSLHKSCTSCTLSEFPCTWCIQNHVCTHDVENNCKKQDLVYGQNSVGHTIGPAECPRFELQGRKTNKILVPSGITKKITVKGLHMKDFMKENIRCEFFGVREVGARVTDAGSDQIYIECNQVDFSYADDRPEMNVVFHIYWREGLESVQRALDNPEKIQVRVFKCNEMAKTCGHCMLLDPKFNCGWCNETNTCSIQNKCPYWAGSWLNNMHSCSNVEVSSNRAKVIRTVPNINQESPDGEIPQTPVTPRINFEEEESMTGLTPLMAMSTPTIFRPARPCPNTLSSMMDVLKSIQGAVDRQCSSEQLGNERYNEIMTRINSIEAKVDSLIVQQTQQMAAVHVPTQDVEPPVSCISDELTRQLQREASSPGHFAALLLPHILPELFGPTNKRYLFNWNGTGGKQEISPQKKEMLRRIVNFYFPESRNQALWNAVVLRINKRLRRVAKSKGKENRAVPQGEL